MHIHITVQTTSSRSCMRIPWYISSLEISVIFISFNVTPGALQGITEIANVIMKIHNISYTNIHHKLLII